MFLFNNQVSAYVGMLAFESNNSVVSSTADIDKMALPSMYYYCYYPPPVPVWLCKSDSHTSHSLLSRNRWAFLFLFSLFSTILQGSASKSLLAIVTQWLMFSYQQQEQLLVAWFSMILCISLIHGCKHTIINPMGVVSVRRNNRSLDLLRVC